MRIGTAIINLPDTTNLFVDDAFQIDTHVPIAGLIDGTGPASFWGTGNNYKTNSVILHKQIILFADAWSKAFVNRMCSFVRKRWFFQKDGVIILPYDNGGVSLPVLDAWFGQKGEVLNDAYVKYHPHLVEMNSRSVIDVAFEKTRELVKLIKNEGDGVVTLPDAYNSISYRFGSVRTKVPTLRYLIDECCDRTAADLKFLDVGGGGGCIASEMRLNAYVSSAMVIDANPSYAHEFALIRNAMNITNIAHLVGYAEDVDFPRSDVVFFSGSLLLMPKEQHVNILTKAWNCLSDGGLLVVQENVKEDYLSEDIYYEKMFTPQGIDGLLGDFGKVRYFSTSEEVELEPENVLAATVHRVVRKP